MSMAKHIDEMVILYTLDRMSLRLIGKRYRCAPETVAEYLIGAGVEIRPRGRPNDDDRPPVASAAPAQPAPSDVTLPGPKPKPPARQPGELPYFDAQHVNAVIRALHGNGFPYLPFSGASS